MIIANMSLTIGFTLIGSVQVVFDLYQVIADIEPDTEFKDHHQDEGEAEDERLHV